VAGPVERSESERAAGPLLEVLGYLLFTDCHRRHKAMSSLKEMLFSSPRKIEIVTQVPTPEWPELDGKVYVRTMSAKARDKWEADIIADPDKRNYANLRAKLVVSCACDVDGVLIFEEADANRLGDEPAPVIDRLWEAGRKLSGISDEDQEELAKNSGETADAASPSS
jgi:hypothetical protein